MQKSDVSPARGSCVQQQLGLDLSGFLRCECLSPWTTPRVLKESFVCLFVFFKVNHGNLLKVERLDFISHLGSNFNLINEISCGFTLEYYKKSDEAKISQSNVVQNSIYPDTKSGIICWLISNTVFSTSTNKITAHACASQLYRCAFILRHYP